MLYRANYAVLPRLVLQNRLAVISEGWRGVFGPELWVLPNASPEPALRQKQSNRLKRAVLLRAVRVFEEPAFVAELRKLEFDSLREDVFDAWFELIELEDVVDVTDLDRELEGIG